MHDILFFKFNLVRCLLYDFCIITLHRAGNKYQGTNKRQSVLGFFVNLKRMNTCDQLMNLQIKGCTL